VLLDQSDIEPVLFCRVCEEYFEFGTDAYHRHRRSRRHDSLKRTQISAGTSFQEEEGEQKTGMASTVEPTNLPGTKSELSPTGQRSTPKSSSSSPESTSDLVSVSEIDEESGQEDSCPLDHPDDVVVVVTIPVEPIADEPIQAEPIQAEPIQAEPIQAEPIQAELIPEGPILGEPIQAEPFPVEPFPVEPIPEGPIPVEPILVEPFPDEPIPVEPILVEPFPDEPIPEGPIQAEPIQDKPIQDEPIQAELIPMVNGYDRSIFSISSSDSSDSPER